MTQQGHDRLDGCLLNLSFTDRVAGARGGTSSGPPPSALARRRRRRDALDGAVHPDDPRHRHLHRPALVSRASPRLLSPGRLGSLELPQPHRACARWARTSASPTAPSATPGGLVRGPGPRRRRPGDRRLGGGRLPGRVLRRPPGRRRPTTPTCPGSRRLADDVHRHGAAIAAQLVHDGTNSLLDIAEGRPLLVPSQEAARRRPTRCRACSPPTRRPG